MKGFIAFISTLILTGLACIIAYETWGFFAALVIFVVCISVGVVVMSKIISADVSRLKEKGDINTLYERVKAGDMNSSVYARGLGEIDDPRAFEMLLELLKHDDLVVRASAAEGLGLTGNPRAVEPLITALNDYQKGLNVVSSAVYSLGKLGDPRAVGPLTKVLHNDYLIHIHADVVEVLGNFGDPLAIQPLINALKDDDVRGLHQSVIYALVKIGKPAVEPLIIVLNDENSKARRNAAEALKKITKQDFGENQVKWQQWWDENKEELLKDR